MATHAKPSEATRRVSVGSVPLGGGAPVVVQSMLNAPATDVAANLVQIDRVAKGGSSTSEASVAQLLSELYRSDIGRRPPHMTRG